MNAVPSCDIESSGRFKYILIVLTHTATKTNKVIVRGYSDCPFHGDILDKVEEALGDSFTHQCTGGGRILVDPANKSINVFGYSQGYGQADHSIARDLISTKYPAYTVTTSNEGY